MWINPLQKKVIELYPIDVIFPEIKNFRDNYEYEE